MVKLKGNVYVYTYDEITDLVDLSVENHEDFDADYQLSDTEGSSCHFVQNVKDEVNKTENIKEFQDWVEDGYNIDATALVVGLMLMKLLPSDADHIILIS